MEIRDSLQRNLTLRKNIRRMELDSYFQERRNELLEQMGEGEDYSLLANSSAHQ
jgi:hypothetical protein